MRILLLVGHTYPVLGGTELASWEIANKLAERGNEVTIVTRFTEGFKPNTTVQVEKMKEYEELVCKLLKVHRVKIPKKTSSIGMGGRFIRQTFKAFKVAWKDPPDIILSFTLVPQCFSAMVLRYLLMVTKLRRIPVIAWGRGSDIAVTPHRKDYIGKLVRFLLKIVFRANLVLAQTSSMRDSLIKFGCKKNKIAIIGNGIDIEKYSKHQGKYTVNNKVIFVGGARPAKGLLYLISAVNQLPDVELLVVGGWGEEYWSSRAIAKKNIKFIGEVLPKEVPNYLGQASIFCLPSLSEGFPNCILEAMAMGLPIIASNVCGIPDILGEAGILVPSKNIDALRDSIKKMLDNPESLKEYHTKSLERIKSFTWENVIDDLEHNMEEMVKW